MAVIILTAISHHPPARPTRCRVQKTFSAGPCSFNSVELWVPGLKGDPVQPQADSRHGRIAFKLSWQPFSSAGKRPPPIKPQGFSPTPFASWRPLSLNSFSLTAPCSGPGRASGGDGLPNHRSRRRRSPRVTDSPRPGPEARPRPPNHGFSFPPPKSRPSGPETSAPHRKAFPGSGCARPPWPACRPAPWLPPSGWFAPACDQRRSDTGHHAAGRNWPLPQKPRTKIYCRTSDCFPPSSSHWKCAVNPHTGSSWRSFPRWQNAAAPPFPTEWSALKSCHPGRLCSPW